MSTPPLDPSGPAGLPAKVLEIVADRFRLLADPSRLRIVNQLHARGELSVGELVDSVGLSYGTVSKHLALLRAHGSLRRRREGTRMYYEITDPSLTELCDAVCRSLRRDWESWGQSLEPSAESDAGRQPAAPATQITPEETPWIP